MTKPPRPRFNAREAYTAANSAPALLRQRQQHRAVKRECFDLTFKEINEAIVVGETVAMVQLPSGYVFAVVDILRRLDYQVDVIARHEEDEFIKIVIRWRLPCHRAN